ncbi:cytochrome P450 71A1-like [Cucurbita moschata]|uniref:Cytochrome P450 71A1-like n=1 Tax=Cucurbita moschata TaxID=3662 RepID=A0A6J1EDL2_CUCMO|nr:cytochrome P450 71A1-like [Cucurbita moschata]
MDPISYKNVQLLHQITQAPLPLFLFLFLFLFLLSLKLFSTKSTKALPPSPPQLPIIGNLHQLGSLPHRSVASLSDKYGPLMLLKLGQTPTLVVSSAKLAREVMKSHDTIFSNRYQNRAAQSLIYGCRDVAFASYGEQWRQARKLCVLELLSGKRVESFQYVRDEEVGELVKKIRKSCGFGDSGVNLNQLLMSTSNNIVSRCVLGEKLENGKGMSGFGDVTRKVMVLLSAFCVGDALPWLGWVDAVRGFHRELKNTFEALDGLFDRVIDEHREKMKNSDRSGEMDFVDIILQLQQRDTLDYRFSMNDYKAILLDMFVGGTDTTATGLEWAMAELMRNPTAMKKVQEEVRTVTGKKPKIEAEDIQKMKYMQCVIKESLRLHPPVPLLVPRQTMGTVNLEGYEIPPKTSVWVNAWAIQRDPKSWENPNEFIPERFMEPNSVDFKGQDFEFVPFGSGRRKCIGMSFGLAAFESVLANLLYWFDWKLPAGKPLDMTEEHGLSVFMKHPLSLVPIPHSV